MFTLTAQRQLPNLVVASPKDEQELRRLMHTAFGQDHPFALHYPRDPGFDLPEVEPTPHPGRRGRGAARGHGHPDRRLRADRDARCRSGRPTDCGGLVRRADQRALRQAARPRADPQARAWQEARRDARGERRDGGLRRQPCWRRWPRPAWPTSRCAGCRSGWSACRAIISSITARWRPAALPAHRHRRNPRAGPRGTRGSWGDGRRRISSRPSAPGARRRPRPPDPSRSPR